MFSAMTLKNGLVRVSTDRPMVPLLPAAGVPVVAGAFQVVEGEAPPPPAGSEPPHPTSATAAASVIAPARIVLRSTRFPFACSSRIVTGERRDSLPIRR